MSNRRKIERAPDETRPHIVVKKARRLLELWQDGQVLACFPIALGSSPLGPKRLEGDGCTPEGEYYICTRNEASRYYLALGLSYPNRHDADAGLKAGVISAACYRKIDDAQRRRARSAMGYGPGRSHHDSRHGSWARLDRRMHRPGERGYGCIVVSVPIGHTGVH